MRARPGRLFSALAAAFVALGAGGSAGAETMSWAQVKERVAARSPSALIGKQGVRAARAEAEGAGRWPRHNPVLTGSFETGAPFGHKKDLGFSVGIEQELDIAGVASASARAADKRIAVAEKEAAVLRQEALAEAFDAFIDLDRAQRSLVIWVELDAMFRAIAGASAKAAGAGQIAALDAILAEADSAGATAELEEARRDLARAQARLAVLTAAADPAALKVTSADEVPPPDTRKAPELAALAAGRRPELPLWRSRADEADARRTLAAREVFPQPAVGVGFRFDRSEEGRDVFLGNPGGLTGIRDAGSALEVTLSIPLPFFDRNQADRARALADASAAREGEDVAGREVRGEVMRAKAAVDATYSALSRFQSLEPKLTQAKALLEKGFSEGQVGLFDTLAGAERVARARVRAIDARAAYLKARAELARAVGEEP